MNVPDLLYQIRRYFCCLLHPRWKSAHPNRLIPESELPLMTRSDCVARVAGFNTTFIAELSKSGTADQIISQSIRASQQKYHSRPFAFDTVAVQDAHDGTFGIDRYLFAQVRSVFSVEIAHQKHWLAYVWWFVRDSNRPHDATNMWTVRPSRDGAGQRKGEVVALDSIVRKVQLLPYDVRSATYDELDLGDFARVKEEVLERHGRFYVNKMSDLDAFTAFY
jgi:hypothetical protein